MDTIAAPQNFSPAKKQRGVRPAAPDEGLSRLGTAFLSLDAVLLAGDASPGLRDRWWTVVQDAMPIRARAARGRRIKATMLLAVIRQTRAAGPACDLARSVAIDLTGRAGQKKKSLSPIETRIQYVMEQGLSRRAARVLTALGCEDADAVLSLGSRDFCARQNCGRVTSTELRTFAQERRRLQDEC